MFHHEINGFCLYISFFSGKFLQAIFFSSMKFQILHSDNFSMKQEIHVFFTLQALYYNILSIYMYLPICLNSQGNIRQVLFGPLILLPNIYRPTSICQTCLFRKYHLCPSDLPFPNFPLYFIAFRPCLCRTRLCRKLGGIAVIFHSHEKFSISLPLVVSKSKCVP